MTELDRALAIARRAGRSQALNEAHKAVFELALKSDLLSPQGDALLQAMQAIYAIPVDGKTS